MLPIKIIQTIYHEHSDFFKRKYSSQSELCQDLELKRGTTSDGADISPSAFSKAINGIDENESVNKSLAKLEIREKVATAFGLLNLFDCRDEQEIARLISKHQPLPPETHEHGFTTLHPFLKITASTFPTEPLAIDEGNAVKKLSKIMSGWECELFHWDVEPWVGATFVACNLLKGKINSIFLVRATRLNDPYSEGLDFLRNELNIRDGLTGDDLATSIVTAQHVELLNLFD